MSEITPVRSLTHLQALESEAIHVMREVAAELERPVLLFSGGKDGRGAGAGATRRGRHQTCSPHSVFARPAHRPSRPAPGSVQWVQPMDA